MTDIANAGNVSLPRAGVLLLLGASERCGGVNFALFSRHAMRVTLLLFDAPADEAPCRTFDLEPMQHRTGDVWRVWIKGLGQGAIYAWRVDGPYQPEQGHRFNVQGAARSLRCRPGGNGLLGCRLCLLLNAERVAIEFELPLPPGYPWRVAVDTARMPPQDIHASGDEPLLEEPGRYRLGSHSLAILLSG